MEVLFKTCKAVGRRFNMATDAAQSEMRAALCMPLGHGRRQRKICMPQMLDFKRDSLNLLQWNPVYVFIEPKLLVKNCMKGLLLIYLCCLGVIGYSCIQKHTLASSPALYLLKAHLYFRSH